MSCNSAEVAANDGSSNGGEKQQQQPQQLVCVTGAGGFIGSWVVRELLLRGYRVRGTARDPSKNAHLLALDGAGERLTLCRADVLDCESLRAAFAGCHGVFHVASPVSNDPVSSLFRKTIYIIALFDRVDEYLQMAAAAPFAAESGAYRGGWDEERDERGGGHGRAARGVHVVVRRRAHEPQPEPRHRPRRDLLERPQILPPNRRKFSSLSALYHAILNSEI
jgi:hypothetical protein